jgi:hypothetical protein
MGKKIVRLTESDLARIVKRVIMEQGVKTPFDPDLDLKMSGPVENKLLDGFKLIDVNFPEYGLMGKRPEPNADIPKTLAGEITTPSDWISKGQIKLSNGKKELLFLGFNKLGQMFPNQQYGTITSANQSCKGVKSGGTIPEDCTVFIKLKDNTVYACDNQQCYKR